MAFPFLLIRAGVREDIGRGMEMVAIGYSLSSLSSGPREGKCTTLRSAPAHNDDCAREALSTRVSDQHHHHHQTNKSARDKGPSAWSVSSR